MKTALLSLQVQMHSINTYKIALYWEKVASKKHQIGRNRQKNSEKRQKVAKICSDLLDFVQQKQLETNINQNERHPKELQQLTSTTKLPKWHQRLKKNINDIKNQIEQKKR